MKLKRIISICLVVLMLCGIMVGCGNSSGVQSKDDPDEVVTLRMVLPWAKQKDADQVLTEINKQLETLLPNTKLEILWEANLDTRWQLLMATKESIDLAHSGFSTDLESEVSKKSYIELDAYIDEYAPNIQELEEKYWYAYDTGRISGTLYAIPNVQTHLNNVLTIEMPQTVASYVDVQALSEEGRTTDTTTEKFWEILDRGFEKAVASGCDITGELGLEWYRIAKKGYEFIGGDDSNICYKVSGEPEIIDFYTTDEFKAYCKYMKIWADKGYVSQDVLASSGGWWTRYINPFYISEGTQDYVDSPFVKGFVNVILEDSKSTPLVVKTGELMTYWSVPFTAKHPARAIRFLDLLHSEEGAVIANLLAYGIEGKHYEFTDKEQGNIKAFEYEGQGGSSVSYGVPGWMVSNMLEGLYSVSPYTYEHKNFAKEYYKTQMNDKVKHPLYGIQFDMTEIKTQMSNILKNNAELAANYYSGILSNRDGFYTELMDKNKTAGISDVISNLQGQADKYIASQK